MQTTTSAGILVMVILIAAVLLSMAILFVIPEPIRQHFSEEISSAQTVAQAHVGLRCPKCSGNMEKGFVIDRMHGPSQISEWIPGAAERSRFGDLKADGAELIFTFRCAKCGYVESYTK
jgi:hypothetical protein